MNRLVVSPDAPFLVLARRAEANRSLYMDLIESCVDANESLRSDGHQAAVRSRRVRRRVLLPWWLFGLGLGSVTPSVWVLAAWGALAAIVLTLDLKQDRRAERARKNSEETTQALNLLTAGWVSAEELRATTRRAAEATTRRDSLLDKLTVSMWRRTAALAVPEVQPLDVPCPHWGDAVRVVEQPDRALAPNGHPGCAGAGCRVAPAHFL